MRNVDDVDTMIDHLTDLTNQQRQTIRNRYYFLMTEYRRRCRIFAVLFYTFRVTMTVGSLAVPALLSIQTSQSNPSIYWLTWSFSLAVTAANGLNTLFKLDKRYFMLHSVAERLRTEIWQYFELSGRYSGHHGSVKPTHRNQYVYFCSQLERIRMHHIEEEYVRQAVMADNAPHRPSSGNATALTSNTAEPTPHRNESLQNMTVPSPADQALLKTPAPRVPVESSFPPPYLEITNSAKSAESEDSVEIHDTIIQLNGPAPIVQVHQKEQPTHQVPMSGGGRTALPPLGTSGKSILRRTSDVSSEPPLRRRASIQSDDVQSGPEDHGNT